jgi:hypothetical protein
MILPGICLEMIHWILSMDNTVCQYTYLNYFSTYSQWGLRHCRMILLFPFFQTSFHSCFYVCINFISVASQILPPLFPTRKQYPGGQNWWQCQNDGEVVVERIRDWRLHTSDRKIILLCDEWLSLHGDYVEKCFESYSDVLCLSKSHWIALVNLVFDCYWYICTKVWVCWYSSNTLVLNVVVVQFRSQLGPQLSLLQFFMVFFTSSKHIPG